MLAVLGLGGVPGFTASTPRLSTTGSSSLHASTAGAGTAAPVAMCVMSNTQVEAAEVASNAEERGECSSLRLLRSVGDKGEQIGQFNGPRHIAALPGGQGVCLVDGLNERVLVLDAEGECVRCVDGMATPTGVAIEDDTLWWAESTGAHRVKRLRLSARSMSTAADANVGKRVVDVQRPWAAKAISAGGLGSASGELHDPSCLCVSGDLLLVAEEGNHRISIFDKNTLEFVRHIAGPSEPEEAEWYDGGNGEGELDQPCGVAVCSERGQVFVCDTWNHRISVFSLSDGSCKRARARERESERHTPFHYSSILSRAQGRARAHACFEAAHRNTLTPPRTFPVRLLARCL